MTEWDEEAIRRNFLMRVDKNGRNGCWIWTGAFSGEYGVTNYKGMRMMAHRAAHILFIGPIPDGHVVRHKCDNRMCVNYVDHLVSGTQKENIADMIERGRRVFGRSPGEMNGRATLTSEQVLEIANAAKTPKYRQELAAKFGVSIALVSKIRSGESWRGTTRRTFERAYTTSKPGASNGNALLTDEKVLEIRAAPNKHGTVQALAAKFGVSLATIRAVRYRSSWKHVPEI